MSPPAVVPAIIPRDHKTNKPIARVQNMSRLQSRVAVALSHLESIFRAIIPLQREAGLVPPVGNYSVWIATRHLLRIGAICTGTEAGPPLPIR